MVIGAAAALLIGCTDDPVGSRGEPAPAIDLAGVVANPHNVLSAIVSVEARNATAVGARVWRADDQPASAVLTPEVEYDGTPVTVPVLGLLPSTRYTIQPFAVGDNATVNGPQLEITTGALPADLPVFGASGSSPGTGYVAFAATRYAIVIDNTGRVVWYRHFPDGAGLNLMTQPTGRYVLHPPTPELGDVEPWVELDPLGNITRTIGCANGLPSRLHDIILEPDGSYWLLCDEIRVMDLTAEGGVANARVVGTQIQHVSAVGTLLFSWSPFDHFHITDLEASERRGSSVNWTHGNAIDRDAAGNLLLSSRSLGEITKIDGTTGAVIWRLGGRRNQFTFLDAETPAFAHQHSARMIAPGELILLDNLGDRTESRAERYLLNETARTARLAHSHAPRPTVITEIGGSVQRGDDRTLVSFGTAGRVEEYDDTGAVVWRIDGHPGYIFRAHRIRSLYAPGVGTGR
jgi:hypothetical protein